MKRQWVVFSANLLAVVKKILAKIQCKFRGCDFGPVVFISPSMLLYCRCCGEEIQDRLLDDLEPMTDEDYEFLETLEALSDERL